MSQAGLTNEKLYQARLLLAMIEPAAPRAARNALLDAAVFCMHTALLSFLREIAAVHRLPPAFLPSVDALEQALSQRGITDSCVVQLQTLARNRQWPDRLASWYRAAAEGEDAPDSAHHHHGLAIPLVDADELSARNAHVPDAQAASDALAALRQFVDSQRAHLVEW